MRFQLVLVLLATIVCFAIGGVRFRERWASTQTYASAESAGKWMLVTGDYSGLRGSSRDRGTEPVTGFASLQANQAWDLSPDFRRAALVDTYSYSGSPGIKVFAANRTDPIAEAAPTTGGTFYCPLFDDDGSLLFLETRGSIGAIRRLDVPKVDSANSTSRVTDVRTATPLSYTDCFERTLDGETLAWVGSDSMIHVARKSSSGGYLGDHKTFAGIEFAMNDSGTEIAIRDGAGIHLVDVASGTQRTLTSDPVYSTLVDFSPDGRWVAVMTAGSFSGSTMSALRTSDASVIALPVPRNSYHYAQPGQALARWVSRP